MTAEYTSNNFHTTLTGNGGSITASQTTFVVASVTGMPALPFRLVMGPPNADPSEIALVTGAAGTTLTATRGIEAVPGTGVGVGVSHNDGDVVAAALTAAGIPNLGSLVGATGLTGATGPSGAGYLAFKGTWNSGTAYILGDGVYDTTAAATFICISAHTNHEPPNATYWAASGAQLNVANTWTAKQTMPVTDKGGQVFNVKAYGALCDGSTDDTTAVLAAITAASASGGVVLFPVGVCLVNTTASAGGLTWILPIAAHNVTLAGEAGAILRTTASSGSLLFIAGASLPSGPANWLANDCWRFTGDTYQGGGAISPACPNALYNINSGAVKGALTVTTTTAANAGNFAAGDYIYIRAGQVVPDGNNWNAEPDGEINVVLSANAGTGVITLERPLAKAYVTEYQSAIGAASSTTVNTYTCPLGVVKITPSTIKNFTLRNLRLEAPNSTSPTTVVRGAVDGLRLEHVRFDTLSVFADWNQFRDLKVIDLRGIMRGTSSTFSPVTVATGCSDVDIDGLTAISTTDAPVLQITEGAARVKARRLELFSGGGASHNEIMIGVRARDIDIDDFFIAGSNTSNGINIAAGANEGGRIGRGVIRKPSMSARAILCNSTNWIVDPAVDGLGGDVQFANIFASGVGMSVRVLSGWVDYANPTVQLGVAPGQIILISAGVSVYTPFNAGSTNTVAFDINGGAWAGPFAAGSAGNFVTQIGLFADAAYTYTGVYAQTGAAATAGRALVWMLYANVPTQI